MNGRELRMYNTLLKKEYEKMKFLQLGDKAEICKTLERINGEYLTDIFKLKFKIQQAIEYIKDRLNEVEKEELQWVEMSIEEYNEEYKKLLEILEGKNEKD